MLCENIRYGVKLQNKFGAFYIKIVPFSTFPNGLGDGDSDWFPIPCRKCLPCRLNHAAEWATRCVLEAKAHGSNMFLTLTFSDLYKPSYGVSSKDLSRFMKTLRKYFERQGVIGIRFFACGEYGGKYQRPHYHVLLFGCPRFPDEVNWKYNRSQGYWITVSEELNRLWGKGFCTIGQVNEQSAGYVARYTMKKLDGVVRLPNDINPEFIQMSRRPGVGMKYYEANKEHFYKYDEILLSEGKFVKVPKAFDRKFKEEYDKVEDMCIKLREYEQDDYIYPAHPYAQLKEKRKQKARALLTESMHVTGLTEKELAQQKLERLKTRIKRLERSFEEWHY